MNSSHVIDLALGARAPERAPGSRATFASPRDAARGRARPPEWAVPASHWPIDAAAAALRLLLNPMANCIMIMASAHLSSWWLIFDLLLLLVLVLPGRGSHASRGALATGARS